MHSDQRPRAIFAAPRPRRGRYFLPPRDPSDPATLPTLGAALRSELGRGVDSARPASPRRRRAGDTRREKPWKCWFGSSLGRILMWRGLDPGEPLRVCRRRVRRYGFYHGTQQAAEMLGLRRLPMRRGRDSGEPPSWKGPGSRMGHESGFGPWRGDPTKVAAHSSRR